MHAKSLQSRQSCHFATLWTVAHQTPLSMGFSRQENWSGLSFPTPVDLYDPRLLGLLHWQVGPLPLVPPGNPLSTRYIPYYLSSYL